MLDFSLDFKKTRDKKKNQNKTGIMEQILHKAKFIPFEKYSLYCNYVPLILLVLEYSSTYEMMI